MPGHGSLLCADRSRRGGPRRDRARGFDSRDPSRQRAADGLGMILLQVVQSSSEMHHAAMLERGGKFAGEGRRDDCPGLAGEKQFWKWRGPERGVGGLEHGVNVRRLARDRELARQNKNGLSTLRRREWRAVGVKLVVGEPAHDRTRKALDEGVRLEHQLLADARRAEFLERLARNIGLMEVLP